MAKKASGLGRGLGELLEDNAPQVNRGHRVILKKEEQVCVSPLERPFSPSAPYGGEAEAAPKPLFDAPIRNRSIKANFKNLK